MAEFTICAVAVLLLFLAVVEAVSRVRYRITSTHLEVRLFGVCLRRILLTDIGRISKHRYSFCEAWPNTFQTRKRVLVLTRRRGLVKYFLITPEQRYVFKHRLKQAMAQAKGEQEVPALTESEARAEDDDED